MKAFLLVLVTNGHPEIGPTIEDFSEDLQTRLGSVIWSMARSIVAREQQLEAKPQAQNMAQSLPNRITFPYARHSSLPELRHLVETFKPKDIWPNTVDMPHWQERGITMRNLFGDWSAGDVFEHDLLVEKITKEHLENKQQLQAEGDGNTQHTSSSGHPASSPALPSSNSQENNPPIEAAKSDNPPQRRTSQKATTDIEVVSIASSDSPSDDKSIDQVLPSKRSFEEYRGNHANEEQEDPGSLQDDSQASILTARAYETRHRAFHSADSNSEGAQWSPIGFISTSDHHSEIEEELGHA